MEGGSTSKLNDSLNNFLHRPIISDVAWHLFWIVRMLFYPLASMALLLNLLVKLCTGGFVTRYEAPQGRAILITGCDSGFGHMLALELVEKGWRVYAGCLTLQGVEALQSKAVDSAGIMIAVPMDVTKQADIDRVVKQIEEECPQKFFALVNNAGVGRGGLIDWTSLDEYRTIMEVNFFALATMCKACLPLLKENRGRIVNVTSLAGIFHGMPFTSAYAASKHAAEAFTTVLRLELEGWGIKVITISPSYHRTEMGTKGGDTLKMAFGNLDGKTKAAYGEEYNQKAQELAGKNRSKCWDPQNVVNAMISATTAVNPRSQYIVGKDAVFRFMPLMTWPKPLVEKLVSKTAMKDLVPARVRQQQEEEKQQQQQQKKEQKQKKDLKSQ